MPDTATIIGPVVRMCEDPDCRGLNACPGLARDLAKMTDKSLGLADGVRALSLTDKALCQLLAQGIACSAPSDTKGVQRMVPDGCEFTAHRGLDQVVAVYSGPEASIDDVLADSAEYPEHWEDAFLPRWKRMWEAGCLDALAAEVPDA